VTDFGASGDGVSDDSAAIRAALAAAASGGTVRFPGAGSTYVYNGTLALPAGVSLVGDGDVSTNSATAAQIRINAGAGAAVSVTSGPVYLEHLRITNNGGTGVGIRATRQIITRNVVVSGFGETNLLLEHDGSRIGPYYSLFEDSSFTYAAKHGAVVGNGANVVTFTNCRFFWNGWSDHNPNGGASASTNSDGLFVGTSYNPNGVPVVAPQSLDISGGDASYNSRYGWHFDALEQSPGVQPGYSEDNHSFGTGAAEYAWQARVGNGLYASFVSFGRGADPNTICLQASFYRTTNPSTVFAGGQPLPQARDAGDASGYYNLASLRTYLSVGSNGGISFVPNTATGDAQLSPSGTTVLRIGTGETALSVTSSQVTMPAEYSWTDGSAGHAMRVASAAPTSGTWAVGDTTWNASSSDGAPVGWRCTVAGTPGVWRPFGVVGLARSISAVTYSGSMTPDATAADSFSIRPTDGNAFTVNPPSGSIFGQRIRVWIVNATGGTLGSATWAAGYKLGSAWTQPTNGFRRYIDFESAGDSWYEAGRSVTDVPN
jgi:hypothetical protein